jgi:hypothetical protein
MNARPFAPSSGRALAARGALRATREQTSHRARNRTDTELRSRPTRTRRRRRAAAADRRRQFFFAESGSGRNDRAAACEVGGDGEVAAPGELSEVRGRRNRTDTAPAGARRLVVGGWAPSGAANPGPPVLADGWADFFLVFDVGAGSEPWGRLGHDRIETAWLRGLRSF